MSITSVIQSVGDTIVPSRRRRKSVLQSRTPIADLVEVCNRRGDRLSDLYKSNPKRFDITGSVVSKQVQEFVRLESFLRRFLSWTDSQSDSAFKMDIDAKVWTVGEGLNTFDGLADLEYYVNAAAIMLDTEQDNLDLESSKIENAYEQICKVENNVLNKLLNKAAGRQTSYKKFTVGLLEDMVAKLVEKGVIPDALFASTFAWDDMFGDSKFHSIFEPNIEHDAVLIGNLGTLRVSNFKIELHTDAFCTSRPLPAGQIYLLAPSNKLGRLELLTDLKHTSIDQFHLNRPAVGWHFHQIQSCKVVHGMVVGTTRKNC